MWDVDATGNAHAQQYAFQNFRMPNGDSHETGVVQVIQDDRMQVILEACYKNQVVPIMLVLRHQENHFYVVCERCQLLRLLVVFIRAASIHCLQ